MRFIGVLLFLPFTIAVNGQNPCPTFPTGFTAIPATTANGADVTMGPYCNYVYAIVPMDQAICQNTPAATWLGEANACLATSPCSHNYRYNGTSVGCVSESPTDKRMLPDLVISPWMAAVYQPAVLDPATLILPVNTTAFNIGLGPLEIQPIGECYCCNDDNTICTPVICSNTIGACAPDNIMKEKIIQRIYRVSNTLGSPMEYEEIEPSTDQYLIYHQEHGHYHNEDWIYASLRHRPTTTTDPNYNNPLAWQIIGNMQKISFCLANTRQSISQRPFAALDLTTAQVMDIINTNANPWANPAGYWYQDPINKNEFDEFPNYFLGQDYHCGQGDVQGFSAGLGDEYSAGVSGNGILLPCNLPSGQYYIVLQVDPLNRFVESKEDNNTAVIPINLTMPSSVPFSGQTITGNDLSHYQLPGSPAFQPTWALDNRINGIVKVGAGYTLTIHDCTIEFMNPQSGIIVEKGGRLIVENSTLRGSECLGNMWKGIQVYGSETIVQTAAVDDPDPNHGYVKLDHATIRDAKVGVQLKTTVPPPQMLLWGGSGKVNAQNSQFIDCSVGIEFAPYKFENPSLINECQFLIQDGYQGTKRFPTIGHVGIYSNYNHTIEVTDCRFENQNPTIFDNIENYGVGIVAKASNFIVGSTDGDEQGNEFINLHKGIDAYSTNAIYGVMNIYNSTFSNVKRGVTLNGCALSEVAHNIFNVQHPGGYGIYSLSSGGSTIAHNSFLSHLPLPAGEVEFIPHWAAVVSNAGDLYDTYLYDNYFTFAEIPPFIGQFYAATQVETPSTGQNRFVYVDCNEYASRNRYDLYIDNNTPSFSNQGGCDPILEDINPTANLWHSIIGAAPQHHIYYANPAASFTITCRPGNVPTNVSSNVEVDECEGDENPCDLFADIGGDYAQKIAYIRGRLLEGNLSDKERDALFAELLRTHVKAKQYDAAKAELESRNWLSDRKLLVSTYTSERELMAATAKLAQIPLDEQPDIDFYNLFTAIVEDLITNPTPEYGDGDEEAGAGKAQIILPEAIETEALRNDKSITNILGQSVAAERQGLDYWRTPNYDAAKVNNAGEAGNNNLYITPNPANTNITISTNAQYATSIAIYDYSGRLVQNAKLYDGAHRQWQINTRELPNGIYICHLLNDKQHIATAKLVIIK